MLTVTRRSMCWQQADLAGAGLHVQQQRWTFGCSQLNGYYGMDNTATSTHQVVASGRVIQGVAQVADRSCFAVTPTSHGFVDEQTCSTALHSVDIRAMPLLNG